MINRVLSVAAFTTLALASQPSAPAPISAPSRELPWGQLNFLHTTDTHGWHAGHLQEPSYSGDWGDYISFAEHLRAKADEQGADLLLIDSGDRIEGNGLYDASDPKGNWTFEIFKEQDIDVLCSGNHELYKQNSSENEYFKTVPYFKGNYLASNLDIIDPRTGELVPLAPRYRKFTTKNNGIRIIAFGFLFNFLGNYNNTVVNPVEETIKEDWFQQVIRDREVDLFLVNGHVPVRSKEFLDIFNAIRDVQWDTPIQFFGGHTHIRDYKEYDSKSYALESGRYMETIGFMSIDGLNSKRNKQPHAAAAPRFNRRYVDNNLLSFHYHTGLNQSTFPTNHGKNVSRLIALARKSLNLDHKHGCAPTDLWLNRASYPSNQSMISWLEKDVVPDMVQDRDRKDMPRIVIINTGAMRFDIFKGPFTRDTTFIVSPFTTGFRYIRNVPYPTAMKILPLINSAGHILEGLHVSMLAPPEQLGWTKDRIGPAQPLQFQYPNQIHLGVKPSLTPGYTTTDDAGTDGDDTIHAPISFYRVPNCVQSEITHADDGTSPETVDLVFLEFIQPYIILALKYLGEEVDLLDTESYMDGVGFTTLITDWVEKNWNGDC